MNATENTDLLNRLKTLEGKYKTAVNALDSIAADYEHMKRKDMVEKAGWALCEIGEWRKVQPGEFARHGKVWSVAEPANTVIG